ncbi:MAG: pectate lyase [Rhodopirellula sp.]|nr:pectate lyase [Rhodopirellula sp.]
MVSSEAKTGTNNLAGSHHVAQMLLTVFYITAKKARNLIKKQSLCAAMIFIAGSLNTEAGTRDCLKKTDKWLTSSIGRKHVDNVLTYQHANGSWPKNVDTTAHAFNGNPQDLKGTFDNGATVNEIRLLARAYGATERKVYKAAFLKGVLCILDTQYPNGGWPQAPQPNGYQRHITFNDGTMVGLMLLLRDVYSEEQYGFINEDLRQRCKNAFQVAVNCILACQIKVNGKLTAWCAQHDHKTLTPRGARSYEHPSISGSESAGITRLLMSIAEPSESIQTSVRSAVQWFRDSKLTGIRVKKTSDGDKQVIPTTNGSPLWARFYEIDTNRPIFSGRDGIIQYDLAKIESERRTGYSWYGTAGQRVLDEWQRCVWAD